MGFVSIERAALIGPFFCVPFNGKIITACVGDCIVFS
jgi:hypothetical protein